MGWQGDALLILLPLHRKVDVSSSSEDLPSPMHRQAGTVLNGCSDQQDMALEDPVVASR